MFFLIKKYQWLCLTAVLALSGCGFHLSSTAEIPEQFKTLTFYSADPYGQLAREVKTALRDNGVTITEDHLNQNIPSLRLTGDNMSKNTISIYQDGKAAEYQLILTVDAEIVIAGDDIHPITVKIFKTFFDNPAAALAKDTEQGMITREMYQQAAEQLVRKLKSVDVAEQKQNP